MHNNTYPPLLFDQLDKFAKLHLVIDFPILLKVAQMREMEDFYTTDDYVCLLPVAFIPASRLHPTLDDVIPFVKFNTSSLQMV